MTDITEWRTRVMDLFMEASGMAITPKQFTDEILALLQQVDRESRLDEDITIRREQEKYLQPMTLEDGKTTIKALAVGMMYATVNNRQAKHEAALTQKGK